jgi:hypothetical protein
MKKNGHGFMIKVRILYSGRRSTVVDGGSGFLLFYRKFEEISGKS